MNLDRRSFLRGLVAAPAVIAADRLMPVKLWKPAPVGFLRFSPTIQDLITAHLARYNAQFIEAERNLFLYGKATICLGPHSVTVPPAVTIGA